MRPCASTTTTTEAEAQGYIDPAHLATEHHPPRAPLSDGHPGVLGGELTGGQLHTPTGVEVGSSPPMAEPAARPPQRPAMHPHGKAVRLVREVPAYPLHNGNGADVQPVQSRPTARQAPVEQRGSTFRAAPDPVDPEWGALHA